MRQFFTAGLMILLMSAPAALADEFTKDHLDDATVADSVAGVRVRRGCGFKVDDDLPLPVGEGRLRRGDSGQSRGDLNGDCHGAQIVQHCGR